MNVEYILLCEPEHISVRGNVLASGNDDMDHDCEDEIIRRLDAGNEWAWFCAHVIARTEIAGVVFEGHDYLGCCSYESEADFKAEGGYFKDMCAEALADLHTKLKEAIRIGRAVEEAVSK